MNTRICKFILFLIIVTDYCSNLPQKGSFYWADREISCTTYAANQTRCVRIDVTDRAEQNPECFDERDENGVRLRVLCALGCEESLEATLVKKVPSSNRQCVQFYTYNLERRRQDWFLWRNGTCLDTTISFHLICGTPTNPKVFYRQNEHLFEYEEAQE